MTDTVTSQTLVDGSKTAVLKFTNVSDGTGESTVTKIDASSLSGSPTKLKIQRVWCMLDGMSVNILFDATANVLAATCNANSGYMDFRSFGGIQNNAGAGVNGNILFTTVGAGIGDTYSIIIEVSKS